MSFSASAQWGNVCLDTNRINPFYQGGPDFSPVCGCDGKTYRNENISYNQAGNNYINQSGVCPNDFFYFDMYPTVMQDRISFFMQFSPFEATNATMQIFNNFGNEVFTKLLNNVSADYPYQETFTFDSFEPGVYIVVIQAKGVFKVKKFLKHNFL